MIDNLDYICAKYGQEIPVPKEELEHKDRVKSTNENMVTKALGVLQEDGVYAFVVYLASEGAFKKGGDDNERVANSILSTVFEELLKNSLGLVKGSYEPKNVYEQFQSLGGNLDNLLFTKELIERTLTYARYHAQALGK